MDQKSGSGKLLLERIESTEDDFESNRLPELLMPGSLQDYEKYLTLDSDALKRLTTEDCSIISLRLSQYSYYVQRMTNRTRARINTVKSEINRIIATNAHNFQGAWDLQREQAIQNNDYTKELNIILVKMQNRYDRLELVALSIKNIAESFKNLKFDKIQKFKQNVEEF